MPRPETDRAAGAPTPVSDAPAANPAASRANAAASRASAAASTAGIPRRVVKLGGSLLTRPGLVEDVRAWFAAARPATDLVVVGGGELIDAIRTLDSVRPGAPAETHWLCIELLDVTFRLARRWFPEWSTIGADASLEPGPPLAAESGRSADPVRPTLVSVGSFYRRGSGSDLPESWETTTDAIAGWLAIRSGASELVLLKSCEVDPNESLEALADRGVVDRAITRLAGQLPRVRIERLSQRARAR